MRIAITGGLGFIGFKLAQRLRGHGELVLFDSPASPEPPEDVGEVVRGDVRDAELVGSVVRSADVVFHLASVVSAQGEQDFDLAMSVNLDGGRNVLEAARALGTRPRVVLASTLAAFGGAAMPETVTDTTKLTPQTTYGTTKAILELLVNDYTRKGFVDGRSARLPTVIVRPGRPNPAASAFASAVFREPLAGRDYVVPVGPETRVPVIGARTAVEGLMRLSELDPDAFGDDRALSLPSISVTVAEMIESVRRVAGDRPLGRLDLGPDPEIERIVRTWATNASSERADALGLPRDESLDDIVREYLEDYG